MTKEFLLKGFPTKAESIASLEKKFSEYLARNGSKEWKWLIKPEAICGNDGYWRSYGRIEWTKR